MCAHALECGSNTSTHIPFAEMSGKNESLFCAASVHGNQSDGIIYVQVGIGIRAVWVGAVCCGTVFCFASTGFHRVHGLSEAYHSME